MEMGENAHSGYGFSTDSSVLGADPLERGETVSAAVWALPHLVTTSASCVLGNPTLGCGISSLPRTEAACSEQHGGAELLLAITAL